MMAKFVFNIKSVFLMIAAFAISIVMYCLIGLANGYPLVDHLIEISITGMALWNVLELVFNKKTKFYIYLFIGWMVPFIGLALYAFIANFSWDNLFMPIVVISNLILIWPLIKREIKHEFNKDSETEKNKS